MNWYNDNAPDRISDLKNLMHRGRIPSGTISGKDIKEINGTELQQYRQCHFFAGIGGWSEALRLAGWPDDKEVWTGSCPCQPFSVAGKRKGTKDARHLWPEWFRLIEQCRPPIIFGEQVASPLGREWLAGIRVEMETLGYAVGAADLCAASVSAPQIRQRLFWVAYSIGKGFQEWPSITEDTRQKRQATERDSNSSRMANSKITQWRSVFKKHTGRRAAEAGGSSGLGFWDNYDLVGFTGPEAGKIRRIKPGIEPLAHGVPRRMAKLRGIGNAIVPQLAAEFIMASIEALQESRVNPDTTMCRECETKEVSNDEP